MRYDYTIREISNGWLVLIDETHNEGGTTSTYFENKFEAFNYVAQTLVDLARAVIENEQKNVG